MTRSSIVRLLTPHMFKRGERQRQLDLLRQRDGDNCRRCRRPLRFDVPSGHHRAPTFQPLAPFAGGAAIDVDALCLCHVRCNGDPADSTLEVLERVRLRA